MSQYRGASGRALVSMPFRLSLAAVLAVGAGAVHAGSPADPAVLAADTRGPRLRVLALDPQLDALSPLAALHFHFDVVDQGRSGFKEGHIQVTGPAGAVVEAGFGRGIPLARATDTGWVATNAFMVPGAWHVTAVQLYDAQGNETDYQAADLAALAGAQALATQVVNARGGDGVPPRLLHGHVPNPSASASATLPNGDPAPLVIELRLAEERAGLVAGLRGASAKFCTDDQARCFQAYAPYDLPLGTRDALLRLHADPGWNGADPGTYRLASVAAWDYAGNRLELDDLHFGGSADLAALFDATLVTITP